MVELMRNECIFVANGNVSMTKITIFCGELFTVGVIGGRTTMTFPDQTEFRR